jgi:hypothetical protein
MTKWFLKFPLLGLLAFSLCHAGDQAKKFAELEGTWTIVKMEIEGKSLLKKDEKWKFIIKDGKMTSDAKGARESDGTVEDSRPVQEAKDRYPAVRRHGDVLRYLPGKGGRTSCLWRRRRHRPREEPRGAPSKGIR